MKNYIYMYELFVKPTFGKKKLVQVKKSDVRRFYNQLIDDKVLKPSTVDVIHNIVRAFHRNAIERRFGDFEGGTLVDVYIDITGYKETAKRPEMLRLMRDCADGKVNLIFAETKGYLSANTREFCYWLHFIFNLKERVDIITDDDQFNINTILNADKQREALIKMAEDYIYLNPPDHQKWLNGVVSAITNLREDG